MHGTIGASGAAAWNVIPAARSAPPSTGDALVYAIGDVHGRYDLLAPLLASIAADAEATARGRVPVLIPCGDYIDRGPGSAQVLEALVWLQRHGDYRLHLLRGNHEQCLLDFLADPLKPNAWLRHGGQETLRSYGVEPPEPDEGETMRLVAARDALLDAMPAAHLRLLEGLENMAEVGDYLFVHAGIRPGRAIGRQDMDDLLWIRQGFLDHAGPLPRFVIHGHSWTDDALQIRDNRIGIDTGAYATDRLTALRLDGTSRAWTQVTA